MLAVATVCVFRYENNKMLTASKRGFPFRVAASGYLYCNIMVTGIIAYGYSLSSKFLGTAFYYYIVTSDHFISHSILYNI